VDGDVDGAVFSVKVEVPQRYAVPEVPVAAGERTWVRAEAGRADPAIVRPGTPGAASRRAAVSGWRAATGSEFQGEHRADREGVAGRAALL